MTLKVVSTDPVGPVVASNIGLAYRRDHAAVVVEVSGELDVLSCRQLHKGLATLIDEQGNLSIVVELSGLEFIDAAGLRVLVHAQHRIRAHGGEIRVARPRPNVRRVIELTGLCGLLHCQPGGEP